MNYYQNPADSANLYWVLAMSSVGQAPGSCNTASASLNATNFQLTLPIIEYQQILYQAELDYYVNPADSVNMYWKLDLSSVVPR